MKGTLLCNVGVMSLESSTPTDETAFVGAGGTARR